MPPWIVLLPLAAFFAAYAKTDRREALDEDQHRHREERDFPGVLPSDDRPHNPHE